MNPLCMQVSAAAASFAPGCAAYEDTVAGSLGFVHYVFDPAALSVRQSHEEAK